MIISVIHSMMKIHTDVMDRYNRDWDISHAVPMKVKCNRRINDNNNEANKTMIEGTLTKKDMVL